MHPDNQGGLAFETETAPNPSGAGNATLTSHRHYLSAGGQVIGVLISSGALPTLGANQSAPTVLGSVTARYAYDPFGKRRQTSGTYDPFGALVVDWVNTRNAGTDRGFTGHEHLDDVGIVHMNGRLYDPNLGVMLQADPFIQDPTNLQNFNRYGYCFNNPLGCTDPSGFSFWTKIRGAVIRIAAAVADVYGCSGYCSAAVGAYYGSKNGGGLTGALVGGVSSYFAFQLGPMGSTNIGGGFGQAAIAGFFSGVAASGDLEGGLKGAFTAAVFFGAGELINGAYTDGFKLTKLEGIAVHAVAGCVTSVAGGGKCGPGALSAAFSKAATVYDVTPKDVIGGTIVSAVVGGTASALGGGKFANGAQTAAFGYLFNELMHSGYGGTDRERMARAGYSDYRHSRLSNGELLVQSLSVDGDVVAQVLVRRGEELPLNAIDALMEVSRAANGAVIDVISGVRDAAAQRALINAGNPRAAQVSQHTVGIAADFYILGMSTSEAASLTYTTGSFPRVNLYLRSGGAVHVDFLRNRPGVTYFVDWTPKKCC